MSDSKYTADMKAAVLPELRELLTRQFDAFFAIALRHEDGEHEKEPADLRACDAAAFRLDEIVNKVKRAGYQRHRTSKPSRSRRRSELITGKPDSVAIVDDGSAFAMATGGAIGAHGERPSTEPVLVCAHADPDNSGMCIFCSAIIDTEADDPPRPACGCLVRDDGTAVHDPSCAWVEEQRRAGVVVVTARRRSG